MMLFRGYCMHMCASGRTETLRNDNGTDDLREGASLMLSRINLSHPEFVLESRQALVRLIMWLPLFCHPVPESRHLNPSCRAAMEFTIDTITRAVSTLSPRVCKWLACATCHLFTGRVRGPEGLPDGGWPHPSVPTGRERAAASAQRRAHVHAGSEPGGVHRGRGGVRAGQPEMGEGTAQTYLDHQLQE